MPFDTWLAYWYRKLLNEGVFPDKIAIPHKYYEKLLMQSPIMKIPKTFLGRPFKIIRSK